MEHNEDPAVSVNMYAPADLALTGLGSLSAPVCHWDTADAVPGAEAAIDAAAEASVSYPDAGKLRNRICLTGGCSDPNPQWGQKAPAALPSRC